MEQQPLGHVLAVLTSRVQLDSLLGSLAPTLAELMPPDAIELEHRRTVGDRLAGRPGQLVRLAVPAGDRRLVLDARGGRTQASIEHVVKGVTLSHREVSVPQWLDALATALQERAEQDEAARVALDRFLLG